jgi:hypothetical protein
MLNQVALWKRDPDVPIKPTEISTIQDKLQVMISGLR